MMNHSGIMLLNRSIMLLEVLEEVLLLDLEPILLLVHIIDLQVALMNQMCVMIAINTWTDPTHIPCMELWLEALAVLIVMILLMIVLII